MIGRILAPVFGIDDDRLLLEVGAKGATHFHAHIEVVRADARHGNLVPQDSSAARRPDVGTLRIQRVLPLGRVLLAEDAPPLRWPPPGFWLGLSTAGRTQTSQPGSIRSEDETR